MKISGVCKTKNGTDVWVKVNGTKHTIGTYGIREVAVIASDLVSQIATAIDHGFIPSSTAAMMLRELDLDVFDKLEEVTGINLDESRLYDMQQAEESRRHAEIVERLLREAEDRIKMRLKLPVECVRTREMAGYPEVPNGRFPATEDGVGLPGSPGVYFVWENASAIVYVGQSVRLSQRATTKHENIMSEDWISFVEIPRADLLYAEAFYIGVCRPRRNFGAFQARLENDPVVNKDSVINNNDGAHQLCSHQST